MHNKANVDTETLIIPADRGAYTAAGLLIAMIASLAIMGFSYILR